MRSVVNGSAPTRPVLGISLSKPSSKIPSKGDGELHGPLTVQF